MRDDYLISCLSALCKRFSANQDDPLSGRFEVAKRSKLSEQYLYQILSGKPMANGHQRSVGKVAREKITAAFPDWLDREPNDGRHAAEALRMPYTHPHPIVRQVIALMEATDDAGKGIVLMAASQALEKYRPIKETAA